MSGLGGLNKSPQGLDNVAVKDGTSCGFPVPTRRFNPAAAKKAA